MGDPDELLAMMPFAATLGSTLDSADAERVSGRLAYRADETTAAGVLHGGALMSLADSLGAVCAYLNLPPGAGTATIGSTTSFFHGVPGGTVRGSAMPLHVGRTTILVQTDIVDDDRLVAQTTQTQTVLTDTTQRGGPSVS